jgi:hypothetical protein
VDLELVVKGKIDWRKWNFGEFDRKFTLNLKFINFVLKFLRNNLNFPIFTFESVNLGRNRKAAKISGGYDD